MMVKRVFLPPKTTVCPSSENKILLTLPGCRWDAIVTVESSEDISCSIRHGHGLFKQAVMQPRDFQITAKFVDASNASSYQHKLKLGKAH
jgi:hypothetical protein